MTGLGFSTLSIASTWRASAARVAVENITERSATLNWNGAPAKCMFTVYYAPKGAQYFSKRSAAHPLITLNGLRPGTLYDVKVPYNQSTIRTSFETVATASTPAATEAQGVPDAPLTELSRLEIRVGNIVECDKHADADTLYVEKVDVGEAEPRTIVSGLVKFVPLEQMIGRSVLVLCNLKPRAMRGVVSQGMLLCASNEDHTRVDPLAAPDSASIGELITFEGHKPAPIEPGNRATKAFDRVVANLRTNSEGIALHEDVPFLTSVGACVSPSGLEGSIS